MCIIFLGIQWLRMIDSTVTFFTHLKPLSVCIVQIGGICLYKILTVVFACDWPVLMMGTIQPIEWDHCALVLLVWSIGSTIASCVKYVYCLSVRDGFECACVHILHVLYVCVCVCSSSMGLGGEREREGWQKWELMRSGWVKEWEMVRVYSMGGTSEKWL